MNITGIQSHPMLTYAEDHSTGLLKKKNPPASEEELRDCLKALQDFYFGDTVTLGPVDANFYLGDLVTLEHMAEKMANQILSPYTHDPQRMQLFKPLQQVIKEKIEKGAEINLFEALQPDQTRPCWLLENGQRVTQKVT